MTEGEQDVQFDKWNALAGWLHQLLTKYEPLVEDLNRQCGTNIKFGEGWWKDLPKGTPLHIYTSKDPCLETLPMDLCTKMGFDMQELLDRRIIENGGLHLRLNIRTAADMAKKYEEAQAEVAAPATATAAVSADTVATQAAAPVTAKESFLQICRRWYKEAGVAADKGLVAWMEKKWPKLAEVAKNVSNSLHGADIHGGAARA